LKSAAAILMPFVAHRVFGWEPVVVDESWGLNTIKAGHAYTVCRSLFCEDCEFLFLDIRFSEAELARLYENYRMDSYVALREFYEPGYALRNAGLDSGINYVSVIEKFLEPHLQMPVSVLDWGGDTGKNTPFRNGKTIVDIYDISAKSVVEGARIVEKHEAFANKYDLVVCSNVVEHVAYPARLLCEIKKAMHSGSVLYLEAPFEALMRSSPKAPHLVKKHWHEHINFFSKKSVIALVEKCGFQIIDISEAEIELNGKSGAVFMVACKLK